MSRPVVCAVMNGGLEATGGRADRDGDRGPAGAWGGAGSKW